MSVRVPPDERTQAVPPKQADQAVQTGLKDLSESMAEPAPEAAEKQAAKKPAIKLNLPPLGPAVKAAGDQLKVAAEKLKVAAAPLGKLPKALLGLYLIGGAMAMLLLALAFTSSEPEPPPAVVMHQVGLSASPSRAEILVNGEPCGIGACQMGLEPGQHRVVARLAGFAPFSQVFDSAPDAQWSAVLEPLPTAIELSSDIDGAKVTLDGEEIGLIEDGEFRYAGVSLGDHELEVRSREFVATFQFVSQPGQAPALVEPISASNLEISAATSLAESARVYSTNQGVEVTLNEESWGMIGEEGVELAGLSAGLHEVSIGEDSGIGVRTSGTPTLAAVLTSDRNVGRLRIEVGLDGAQVYLNDKLYRRQTSRGGLTIYLYPGAYKVRVAKDGFQAVSEQTAEISKGARATLEFRLVAEPTMGSLVITGSAPGAEVLVDGRVRGTVGPDGTMRISGVEPGAHTIELRSQTHRPRKFERELSSGGTIEIDGPLESILGSLTINIIPDGVDAQVSVRSEPGGAPRPVRGSTLTLPEGQYTVSAAAPGYDDFSATIRVEANRTKPVELHLRKIEAPGPPPARNLLSELAGRSGWSRQGELLVRAGGGLVFAPTQVSNGVYRFTVQRRRGRLRWAVGYLDDKNFVVYQLKRSEVERIRVSRGARQRAVNTPHRLDVGQFVTIEVAVTGNTVIHRALAGDEWVEIDRLEEPGAGFDQGRFAFQLARSRDQLALREFVFQARR